jgi:prepilin-type N-terminal cleavage/methylation domain-containing protein
MKKGFTLIEVLLVIAIIAILAIVIFAAIDPIEQIEKTQDGGLLNNAKECMNAAERYYVAHSTEALHADRLPTNCSGGAGAVCSDLVTIHGELKGPVDRYMKIEIHCDHDGILGNFGATFPVQSESYTKMCGGEGFCTIPNEIQ